MTNKQALDALNELELTNNEYNRVLVQTIYYALTQPNRELVEEVKRGLGLIKKHLYTQTEKAQDGISIIEQALSGNTPQEPVNKMLLDALKVIREHTDADQFDSYRCDDREGCLDTIYAIADEAIKSADTPWTFIQSLEHEIGLMENLPVQNKTGWFAKQLQVMKDLRRLIRGE